MSDYKDYKPWHLDGLSIYDNRGCCPGEFEAATCEKDTLDHIMQCVNEHDTLMARIEQLKASLDEEFCRNTELKVENERLKEDIDSWKKMYLLKNSK